jgi:hypothetical protein
MARTPFDRALERVQGLLDLHATLQGGRRGRPTQHASDVLRGALVLNMAALDVAILDAIVDAVPPLARQQRLGKVPAKWIKEHRDPISLVVADDPVAALVECARTELARTTFQKATMIEGFLRDILACPPPWERAAELLSVPNSVWTPDEVQEWLDGYVDRRNRIAHDGDRKPGGAAVPIQRHYVETAVLVVRCVVDGVQDVIKAHVATGPR